MKYFPTHYVNGITQVGWDESTAGERPPRVSLWEIEPLTTFPMYPSLFPLRVKHPWYSGVAALHGTLKIRMLVTMTLNLELVIFLYFCLVCARAGWGVLVGLLLSFDQYECKVGIRNWTFR